MSLKNKRVLITAGPTWVAIDSVRVISNIASGETGILLAEGLRKEGSGVTLILGPCVRVCPDKGLRIIRFRFFDELQAALRKELQARRYDFIIHSAAVSDFKPAKSSGGKIKSGAIHNLKLAPLPKIAGEIRCLAPAACLVLFKLEYGIPDKELIRRGRGSLAANSADLIVANRIEPRYKAYILDKDKIYCRAFSKKELVKGLINIIKKA